MASTKEEHSRQLEAITLSPDCMDADIRAAMFDPTYDNGEIWDDFVAQASAAPEGGDEAAAFDYEAHIARLVVASEKVAGLAGSGDEGSDDEGSEYSDYSDDDTTAAAARARENQDFESALLEYDSDSIGELDEDDERLQGHVGLADDGLGEIMDAFLADHKDQREVLNLAFADGKGRRLGGDVLRMERAAERLVSEKEKAEQPERLASKDEEGADGDAGRALFAQGLARGAVVADGGGGGVDGAAEERSEGLGEKTNRAWRGKAVFQSGEPEDHDSGEDSGAEDYMPDYLAAKVEARFDCMSIISTYSNLDNHPVSIAMERRPAKSSRASNAGSNFPASVPSEGPKRIVLSARTGLPIGVQPEAAPGAAGRPEDAAPAPAAVGVRSKTETKEEKKARKTAAKDIKQLARAAKSEKSAARKAEDISVQKRVAEGSGRASVFRY
jgi:protein LTV1